MPQATWDDPLFAAKPPQEHTEPAAATTEPVRATPREPLGFWGQTFSIAFGVALGLLIVLVALGLLIVLVALGLLIVLTVVALTAAEPLKDVL